MGQYVLAQTDDAAPIGRYARHVNPIRRLILTHRWMAAALIALALLVRAWVPAGYMPGQGARVLTMDICADVLGQRITRSITLPAREDGTARVRNHCDYAVMADAAMGGADGFLLNAALAFILALGFLPRRALRVARARAIRPPLRGPPAHP
jgi:hypothetical protein